MFRERLRNIAGQNGYKRLRRAYHVITPSGCYTPPHPLESRNRARRGSFGKTMVSEENVEGFQVLDLRAGEPGVVARAITTPTDEILPTTAVSSTVEDSIYEVLHLPVRSDDGARVWVSPVGEELVVVGDEGA